jgi:hypothetical protein
VETNLVERLRYEVYCQEKRYLDPEEYPDQRERDLLDCHSIHRAIFSSDVQGHRALACYRLIKTNPLGFPCEQKFNLSVKSPCPDETVEISRLIFSQEVRDNAPLAKLLLEVFCRDFYHTCKGNGVKWCYAIIERPLLVLLRRKFNIEFVVLGEPKLYMNSWNYPTLLDIEAIATPAYRHFFARVK